MMNRRDLLRTGVLASLAAVAAQLAALAVAYARPTRDQARMEAGRPSEYPLGQPIYNRRGRFWVSRVPDGLVVMSARCTHAQCLVPWRAEDTSEDPLAPTGRFNCPCHGSIYDRYGVVRAGPAPRPFDLFPTTLDRGVLVVDTRRPIQRARYEPAQALPL